MSYGTFNAPDTQKITTLTPNTAGVVFWRLTNAGFNPVAFEPIGPIPFTGIYSRIDQILAAGVGAVIGFFDNIGLKLYQGTISAIDKTAKTITVNAPNAPNPTQTFSYLRLDNTANLPITLLA